MREEMKLTDMAAAALAALANHGIAPDIQELLVRGSTREGVVPGALSKAIQAVLLEARPSTAGREQGLEEAVRNILPYLRWTVSPESPAHHPTLPSALKELIRALQSQGETSFAPADSSFLPSGESERSVTALRAGAEANTREAARDIDAAAKYIATTVHRFSWDGLYEGRASDNGFQPWVHSNGRREDYRDLVREIVRLASPQPVAQEPGAQMPWDAAHNRSHAPVEKRAKEIYDKILGAEDFPWVDGGNSVMQDKARAQARDELRAALSAKAVP